MSSFDRRGSEQAPPDLPLTEPTSVKPLKTRLAKTQEDPTEAKVNLTRAKKELVNDETNLIRVLDD